MKRILLSDRPCLRKATAATFMPFTVHTIYMLVLQNSVTSVTFPVCYQNRHP